MPSSLDQRRGVSRLVRALVSGDCTKKQLVTASGFYPSTVQLWIGKLRATKAIRKTGFTPGRAGEVIYGLNPHFLPDATREHIRIPAAVVAANYRARKKLRTHHGTPNQ